MSFSVIVPLRGKLAGKWAFVVARRGVCASRSRGGRHVRDPGGTNWQAVILTLLMPGVAAAGLIALALQPQWDESDTWVTGLFVLIPFEFVRVIVLRILRDAYQDYRTPRHAVRLFLISIAILALLCLIFAFLEAGFGAVLAALLDAGTWKLIAPPAAIIIADGVINLYFFRGDARGQAARLDAAADDAEDWLGIATYPTPIVLAAAYAFLMYLRSRGVPVPDWIPSPGLDAAREMCLLYAAVYFIGKGILIAHVHTARFNRNGERVLGAAWIQRLIRRRSGDRAQDARKERSAARARRDVLSGGGDPESGV